MLRRKRRAKRQGDQGSWQLRDAELTRSRAGRLMMIVGGVIMAFERITIDHAKMGGLPCIRGLRIPVSTVLGQLAAGRTESEILEDFPDLEGRRHPGGAGVHSRGGTGAPPAAGIRAVRFLLDSNLSHRVATLMRAADTDAEHETPRRRLRPPLSPAHDAAGLVVGAGVAVRAAG